MKTTDLIGPALDWAVELALGTHWSPNGYFCHSATKFNRKPKHAYSTDWPQSGPIIERERITVEACPPFGQSRGEWRAAAWSVACATYGPTPPRGWHALLCRQQAGQRG